MSCLFVSLAHFVENMDATRLRKMIVDYLEKDPILIADSLKFSDVLKWEDESISKELYLYHMNMESTWGGAIEIRAFCNLFQSRVAVVLACGEEILFEPFLEEDSNEKNNKLENKELPLLKISWLGNHYEPYNSQK